MRTNGNHSQWQDHRKVASHIFGANGMKDNIENAIVRHGNHLVKLLKSKADKEETIDMQAIFQDFTFETICDIAFGVNPGSLEAGLVKGEKLEFLASFDRAQRTCTMRSLLPRPAWRVLRFFNIGFERVLRKDIAKVNDYVRRIIDQRYKSGVFKLRDDLISMYVKTSKASGKDYMANTDYLVDAVLNFMIAGRDTSSSLLTNLFKLLNESVESKMLEELERVVGKDEDVGWDHIKDLRYCGAVLNEVMRLHPPVGVDFRTCLKEDTLPSGIRVFAGQRVVVPNYAIGRDPHLWTNPDSFIPERWLPEDKSQPTRRPDEFVLPVFWGG